MNHYVQKIIAVLCGLLCYVSLGICSAPAVGLSSVKEFDVEINVAQAQEALKQGCLIPKVDSSRHISWSAAENKIEFLELFLANPAYKKYINKLDVKLGISPLHCAAIRGNGAAAERLIKAGADIYQKDKQELTPFMRGVFHGNIHIVKLLYDKAINKKSMINNEQKLKGSARHNPLVYAVGGGYPDILTFLLENGADAIDVALMFAKAREDHSNDGVCRKEINSKMIALLECALKRKADMAADYFDQELRREKERRQALEDKNIMNAEQQAKELEKKKQNKLRSEKKSERDRLLCAQRAQNEKLKLAEQQKVKKALEYDLWLAKQKTVIEDGKRLAFQKNQKKLNQFAQVLDKDIIRQRLNCQDEFNEKSLAFNSIVLALESKGDKALSDVFAPLKNPDLDVMFLLHSEIKNN